MVSAASAPDPGPGDGTATRSGQADVRSLEATEVVRAALEAVRTSGRVSTGLVSDAVEGAARVLARRVVRGAIDDPEDVAGERQLADALASRTETPALGKATLGMLAARLVRRFGPLKMVFARTPMWLVAAAVPALYASVVRGSDELGLVSSHLVRRARAAGIEPDPERVRRVAVQILSGRFPDPELEPRHGPLAVRWLRRAGRAALPFTSGVATHDPRGIAGSAAAVPPSWLAGTASR